MKKTIIALTIVFWGLNAIAQDSLVSNKSNKYLPKAGAIAVGFDGDPIFTYVGNMFNGTQNNSLNLGDNTLYFRYYLTDDAAIRVKVRIRSTNEVDKYYVQDDAAVFADPLSRAKVEDRYKYTVNSHDLTLGYQMFRSYNRLRGFYGADLGFGISKVNEKFEYGNKMNELNPTPTSTWGGAVRTLENYNGTTKSIFAGIFAGAEYYFMPQVCIGAEFGLEYGKSFTGQSHRVQERMVVSQHVEEKIETNAGASYRNLGTTFPYTFGSFYFMIHF